MDFPAQKDFTRAIMHIDGDSFFVACELTRRPDLRGRPVVTGQERGMATAANHAAKALGVTRGMRTRDIRRNFPSVVILSSDYILYAQYARRMYDIVRRFAGEDAVEEYSIDECFADLTEVPSIPGPMFGRSYEDIARAIQADLQASLGITFSLGLGVNKCTAKIASKWKKSVGPGGFTVMKRGVIHNFLRELPIGKVWGIGSATTAKLSKLGVRTALDLAEKDRAWVDRHCDRPLAEIYEEFQGNFVKELGVASHDPHSVQRTRTFYPPVGANDAGRAFVWSQISYHTEDACSRLRGQGLVAVRAGFFLKTQEFQYLRSEVMLPDPSASPEEVLRAVGPEFEKLWNRVRSGVNDIRNKLMFRASGIYLSGLRPADGAAQTLFGEPVSVGVSRAIHVATDKLARKFGRNTVFLGSSHKALKAGGELTEEAKLRSFGVIYLGEVL